MKRRPPITRWRPTSNSPEQRGFYISRLKAMNYAASFTLWFYDGAGESLADILAPGYFDRGAEMLTEGDHVHISADGGDAVAAFHGDINGGVRLNVMSIRQFMPYAAEDVAA